jgi:hypothetical protein
MRPRSESVRCWRLAALAAVALAACNDGAAGESARVERSANLRAAVKGSACPSVEDMSTAVGIPVTFTQSIGSNPWKTCMYELTGSHRGVFIELKVQPASHADAVYARLHQLVKGMNGQAATPDRVELGEGGWAFGSGSMSRAAVVAKGRLYQADMDYMGSETIGDQKDAMVRVLELAIR